MMLATVCILFSILTAVYGQCTWQSTFASTSWVDNTRGDITFSTTTMTGWSISMRSQTFNQWECIDNSSSDYLVMKATNQLTYSTVNLNVYACLQLTTITDNSFYYYQQHLQESNAGYERLKFSLTTLGNASEICDTTVSVPTNEFHVMVKSGSGSSAAITCPSEFLYSADYVYNDTSTYACADSQDVWDVCSDSTEMTFNYTTCSQDIAYSSGGKLWCVASVGQCVVVYNQDSSITSTTRQFSCLCSDGTNVAVVENNCTATQTPGIIPTGPDGVSAIGYLLTVGTKYVDCVPATTTTVSASSSGGGMSAGVIVGIVIGVLLLIAIVVVIFCFIRYKKKKGKNKVTESAQPILLDTESARIETVSETARSKRPVSRQRSSLSREGTLLNKSVIDGRASVTSVGFDQKSERPLSREKTLSPRKPANGLAREKSNVTLISVKPPDEEEKNNDASEKESTVKLFIARLPCWPKDREPETPTTEPELEAPTTPPLSPKKGAAAKKGAKKGDASVKGGKSKGGKKDTKKGAKAKEEKKGKKGKDEKAGTNEKTEKDDENGNAEKDEKSEKIDKLDDVALTDVEFETPKAKINGPQFTSTPIPKDGKEKSFSAGGKMPTFISMPSSLHKPEDKKTGWPFLVCCVGTDEPVKEEQPLTEPAPVEAPKKKVVLKGKGGTKGKAKPASKGKGGGQKGKKKGVKVEANGKAHVDTKGAEGDGEPEKLDRANTMPERHREKTTLSMIDAEKVKVDVYIPNDKTQLQLKDTVTVLKDKNGDVPMEKAKTTLGLTRPASAVSKASGKSSARKRQIKDETDKKKGKDKASGGKGGKEKKGGAKKKKKK